VLRRPIETTRETGKVAYSTKATIGNDSIRFMKGRRDRRTVQVLILSLVVGALCFFFSFYILVVVGIYSGFLDFTLFGPPPRPQYGWIAVWVGSVGTCVFSSLAFFRYASGKLIPPK